jgi:hypothetical protein
MWINLNDIWVNSDHVAVVRESGLDSDQTVLFTTGQSAMDSGYLIDMPIEDVIEQLQSIAHHELAAQLLDELESETKSS